jgi:hypothetical protein
MMLAALIILTFWIEIHTRCIELARSTPSATRSFAQALLSKPAMCNARFSYRICVAFSFHVVFV